MRNEPTTASATSPDTIVRRWSRPPISSHCGRPTANHSRTYGADVNVRTPTENQPHTTEAVALRSSPGALRRSQRPRTIPSAAMVQNAANAA